MVVVVVVVVVAVIAATLTCDVVAVEMRMVVVAVIAEGEESENQWKLSEVEHLEEGLGEWCRPFLSLAIGSFRAALQCWDPRSRQSF